MQGITYSPKVPAILRGSTGLLVMMGVSAVFLTAHVPLEWQAGLEAALRGMCTELAAVVQDVKK